MAIDLLLTLDPDLVDRIQRSADAEEISAEEWVRRTLIRYVGSRYEPLDIAAETAMRPMMALDLRG